LITTKSGSRKTRGYKVLELAEGLTDRQDIGYGGNATIQARVGGTTGDIYGFGFCTFS
jgi:hypothetical protein